MTGSTWSVRGLTLAEVDRRRTDRDTRIANLEAGRPLCARCDGTGNELYGLYRRCADCGGSGVARPAAFDKMGVFERLCDVLGFATPGDLARWADDGGAPPPWP